MFFRNSDSSILFSCCKATLKLLITNPIKNKLFYCDSFFNLLAYKAK